MNQECPDLFKIGDTWYLLGSGGVKQTVGVSSYSFTKDLNGVFRTPPVQDVIDGPAIYAGKRMFDGKRHIWTGWVADTVNQRDDGERIWGGAQCLPRELRAGPDGQLYQRPVEEVTAAFTNTMGSRAEHSALTPAKTRVLQTPDHYMLQGEVQLDPRATLTIAMRQQPDGSGGYKLVLRPWSRHVELSGPGFSYVRNNPLDTSKPIKVRAFVQGSIIECFINDQFAYTCRAYNYSTGRLSLKVEGGNATLRDLAVKRPETVIAVDRAHWTMTMKYRNVDTTDHVWTTVDYNINGVQHAGVAPSEYMNTLTGDIVGEIAADHAANLGWDTAGPHTGSYSWKFEALDGGSGRFTAFTFDPASSQLCGDGDTARWSVKINGGPAITVHTYSPGQYGVVQNAGTIDLAPYLGDAARTVEIIANIQSNGVPNRSAWWSAYMNRVADIARPGLTVNASVAPVPKPSRTGFAIPSLFGWLAYEQLPPGAR